MSRPVTLLHRFTGSRMAGILWAGAVLFLLPAAAGSGCGLVTDLERKDLPVRDGAADVYSEDAVDDGEDADAADSEPEIPIDGCALAGSSVRLSSATSYSRWPSVVYTGSEFGVAWENEPMLDAEIYFCRVSADGAMIGSSIRVSEGYERPLMANDMLGEVVFTGSVYGIVWADERSGNAEIYYARVSEDGVKLGNDTRITDNPSDKWVPSAAFSGSEIGVFWADGRDDNLEVYFTNIMPDGTRTGSDVRITFDSSQSDPPSVLFAQNAYAIVWRDMRGASSDLYFARISRDGAKLVGDVRINSDTTSVGDSTITYSGSEYAVAWSDGRHEKSEIYFARLSSDGTKLGGDVRVTSDPEFSSSPFIVHAEDNYGIAWMDSRHSGADIIYELYFTRVSHDGVKSDSDIRLTSRTESSYAPLPVFTGGCYGLVWEEVHGDYVEIRFDRLFCSP